MRPLTAVAVLLAALLALAACQSQEPEVAEEDQLPADMVEDEEDGGGEDGGGDGGGEADATVEFTAVDIDYEDVPGSSVSAGLIEFVLTNEGASEHDVTIEELGEEPVVPLVGGGETGSGTAELEAGSYTVFCSVPGHRGAGMEFTLEVQ